MTAMMMCSMVMIDQEMYRVEITPKQSFPSLRIPPLVTPRPRLLASRTRAWWIKRCLQGMAWLPSLIRYRRTSTCESMNE